MLNFEVRTKRLTVTESNRYKTIKETRLFQGENYSEVEMKALAHMAEHFPGEDIKIVKITQSKITDISVEGTGNILYKSKVTTIETSDSGKDIKTSYYILVDANTIEEATENVQHYINGWAFGADINKIEETKLVEVIVNPGTEEPEEQPEPTPKKKGKKK